MGYGKWAEEGEGRGKLIRRDMERKKVEEGN